MRKKLALMSLVSLVACADGGATETTEDTDALVEDPGWLSTLVPPGEVPSGGCPAFEAGWNEITSADTPRRFIVSRPDQIAPGAPVVFAWHGMGDNPSSFTNALGLPALARQWGAVIIAPESATTTLLPWGADLDLALFDDVRACLAEEQEADMEAVSTMGFSAGALWSSELLLQRSDRLATAFIMSGGLLVEYETPAVPTPVFMSEGGDSDVVAVVRFKETTEALAGELVADEHFVVVCSHTQGHTPPPGFTDLINAWIPAHSYGRHSPFEEDLSGLSDICRKFE